VGKKTQLERPGIPIKRGKEKKENGFANCREKRVNSAIIRFGKDLTHRKQNMGDWRKPGQTKNLQQTDAKDSR
jgi:hypothetical protein